MKHEVKVSQHCAEQMYTLNFPFACSEMIMNIHVTRCVLKFVNLNYNRCEYEATS